MSLPGFEPATLWFLAWHLDRFAIETVDYLCFKLFQYSEMTGNKHDKWGRGVKEAIYIRVLRPSLNRDACRFQLPHIWDPLLTSLSERCWSISGQSAEEVHSTWTKAPKG